MSFPGKERNLTFLVSGKDDAREIRYYLEPTYKYARTKGGRWPMYVVLNFTESLHRGSGEICPSRLTKCLRPTRYVTLVNVLFLL